MISAGDFKNGITIQYENGVWQVIEFQHVKPGKGAAFVRTKLKNVINGGIIEKSFRPTEKFENAIINNKNMQYLYKDGDLYYFMDLKSYEQISIPDNIVRDSLKFIKENDEVKVCSYNGNIFSIEPPISVELRVIKTEPGFKGDTSTNAMKPATLETGVEINVPLFININDIIKVDTRTGEYLSRA